MTNKAGQSSMSMACKKKRRLSMLRCPKLHQVCPTLIITTRIQKPKAKAYGGRKQIRRLCISANLYLPMPLRTAVATACIEVPTQARL
eukprot:6173304-Pleurochrysis_carterae.AAC.1